MAVDAFGRSYGQPGLAEAGACPAPDAPGRFERAAEAQTGENVLTQNFNAVHHNQKWLVNITCVTTYEGKLYLAGVLDLFSRKMVGWAMDDHLCDEL